MESPLQPCASPIREPTPLVVVTSRRGEFRQDYAMKEHTL